MLFAVFAVACAELAKLYALLAVFWAELAALYAPLISPCASLARSLQVMAPVRFRLVALIWPPSIVTASPWALVMVTPLGEMRRVWLMPVSRSETDCVIPLTVTDILATSPSTLDTCAKMLWLVCCNVETFPSKSDTWLIILVEVCWRTEIFPSASLIRETSCSAVAATLAIFPASSSNWT